MLMLCIKIVHTVLHVSLTHIEVQPAAVVSFCVDISPPLFSSHVASHIIVHSFSCIIVLLAFLVDHAISLLLLIHNSSDACSSHVSPSHLSKMKQSPTTGVQPKSLSSPPTSSKKRTMSLPQLTFLCLAILCAVGCFLCRVQFLGMYSAQSSSVSHRASVVVQPLTKFSPVSFLSWSIISRDQVSLPVYEDAFVEYNHVLQDIFFANDSSSSSVVGLLKIYGVALHRVELTFAQKMKWKHQQLFAKHDAAPPPLFRLPSFRPSAVVTATCNISRVAPLPCRVFSNAGLWAENWVIIAALTA